MVEFNRVTIAGTLANNTEIWSTSAAYRGSAGGVVTGSANLTAWAEAIVASLDTLLDGGRLADALSSNGRITEIRCYHYADPALPAQSIGLAAADYSGAGTATQPLQSSVVLSLRTALAGRRNRGRMYWPALAIAPSNLGLFTSATATALAENAADLLIGIGAAAPVGGPINVGVVSTVADTFTPVNSVSVGTVPDTQRRRRNGLQETYYSSPV